MTHIRIFLISIVIALNFSACATKPNNKIINIQTQGNLESKYTLGCANIEKMQNFHTPADLYKSFASCMKEENYDKAIYYYLVAGAYGYYDAYRVSDRSARQALTVLKMINFKDIKKETKLKFLDKLKKHRTSTKMKETCKFIHDLGKPDYYPRYMVQHGIRAFTGNNGNGLLKNYDSDGIWNSALVKYIKCKQ